MKRVRDSIRAMRLAPTPKFYISKEAAEALMCANTEVPDEWGAGEKSTRRIRFADIFYIGDSNERYQLLSELVRRCEGVALAKVDGLSVIAVPQPGAKKLRDRKDVIKYLNRCHGVPKEYAQALYSAFGDTAFRICREVFDYLHMPNNRITNHPASIADRITVTERMKPRQVFDSLQAAGKAAQSKASNGNRRGYLSNLMAPLNRADESEVYSALEEYGIDTDGLDIGKILWAMDTSAMGIAELRATLKKRQEIVYIAREYEVSQEVAEAAHHMVAAETDGMVDLGVLKGMDLSMLVRALRHEIDVREAIAAKKPYLDGNDAVLRVADLPTEEQRQCYFQLVGTDHKTVRDYTMAGEDRD